MAIESVTEVIKTAERLTKSPENYLGGQEEYALELRQLIKKLYDYNKYNEPDLKTDVETLNELVIDELDEEQIWQQLELKNTVLCNEFISDIARILVKKNYLNFWNDDAVCEEHSKKKSEDEKDENEVESNSSGEKCDADEGGDKNEGEDYSDLGSDEDKICQKEDDELKVVKKTSVVDDKFFKLSEMEKFLDKVENENHVDSDDEDELIDYFEDLSESDDEKEDAHYNDFFDQPEDELERRKRRKSKNSENVSEVPLKKKVKFQLDNIPNEDDEFNDFTDDENGIDENVDDNNDDEVDEDDDDDDDQDHDHDDQRSSKKNSGELSSFEARQERLKSRIKALEEEALKDKPWQLKGEVTASSRPQNSLLEEFVEFDTAVRPPPVMTEKTTLKLEDIIIQRIKDKAWDDVERKIKPVEDPKEYRKRLVLDQEKSKLSLAQIYEQEYLKKKEGNNESNEDKPEEIPSEQLEIDKMMKSLFYKLDALSNFHFTPKMVTADVKIVSNLPAITVEEVAPTATSDAALLAPEEIKPKKKGDLIGKTERTKTDKKRERRIKKKKQRMKEKALESKEKLKVEKVKDSNIKKNKKLSKKLLKKLGQNVSQANENGNDKYIKSSSAFFTRLQDEVQSHIKSKSKELKKSDKSKKLDVKKLKL